MDGKARFRQLAEDLRVELEAFDAIVEEAERCLQDLAHRPPTYLELRGAGDIAHDFYNAVERFLERVAVEMNGGLPSGSDSHVRLLQRMAREVPDVRPTVLGGESHRFLTEYLRFRHLFRHRYGFELDWEKLRPLLAGIRDGSASVRKDLEAFIGIVADLAGRLA
jgi:hypothetical protein